MVFWRYNGDQKIIPTPWLSPVCLHSSLWESKPFSKFILTSKSFRFRHASGSTLPLPLLAFRIFPTPSPRTPAMVEHSVQHLCLCCFKDVGPSQHQKDGPLLYRRFLTQVLLLVALSSFHCSQSHRNVRVIIGQCQTYFGAGAL